MADSDFVYLDGEPVNVGNPVENDFVFVEGELLSDRGESDFAFIEGRGLGTGTVTVELTVSERNGSEIGTATVTVDSLSLADRVSWRIRGDTVSDNDRSYQDYLRTPDGQTIESFEDGTLSDYSVTETKSNDGSFSIASNPTADGSYSLRADTGAALRQITSDDPLSPIEGGDSYEYDVQHPTDDSDGFAMRTGCEVGTDANGDGGIRTILVNPGAQRTEGALLNVAGTTDRVVFTPDLGQWYTFRVDIL